MFINAASAAITLKTGNAKPEFHIRDKTVVGHLTNGYDPTTADAVRMNEAWSATGTVRVTLNPGESLNDDQFGFVQFLRYKTTEFHYAGKSPDEGSISIFMNRAPALTQTLALDGEETFTPWTKDQNQKRFTFAAGVVTAVTGDHPMVKGGRELDNKKTNKKNFLFHLIDEREFTTVFAHSDPKFKFQYFAHFNWRLRYEAKFNWRQGNPLVASRDGTGIKFDSVVKGPPTDSSLQELLADPKGPMANNLMLKAVEQVIRTPAPENRKDFDKRFANVSPTFVL